MASRMGHVDESLCPDYKTRRRLVDSKEEYSKLTHKTYSLRDWIVLKTEQYNVTSALYMLDWWERLIFNIFMASVFVGTVIAMYVYCHNSGFLFALSAFLLGFLILMLLLCPLHQY